VRLVFREIQLPDGKRVSTWMTNSFVAPSRNVPSILWFTWAWSSGWPAIGGKDCRVAGLIGGTLTGFVIAGNRNGSMLRDLTLKEGSKSGSSSART